MNVFIAILEIWVFEKMFEYNYMYCHACTGVLST